MAVKLSVTATKADENAAQTKIKVVVKAISTYGSWVGDPHKGTIKITGSVPDKTSTFSSAYKANTTTTLTTQYFTFAKKTTKQKFDVTVTFASGTSSGQVKGSDSGTIGALQKLTVHLKGNKNQASNRDVSVYYGQTFVFPTSAGNVPGYTLSKWNTNSSGTGTSYGLGKTSGKITTNNLTFYGIWTPKKYTMTFDANGGATVNQIAVNYGASFTFPSTSKQDNNFTGWLGTALQNTYNAGQTLTWNNTYNETFVAQWSTSYISPQITNIQAFRAINNQVYALENNTNEIIEQYTTTEDTEINSEKTYYIYSESQYIPVIQPIQSDIDNYFEYTEIENFTFNETTYPLYTDGINLHIGQTAEFPNPYTLPVEDQGSTAIYLSFSWEEGKYLSATTHSTTITLKNADANDIILINASTEVSGTYSGYISVSNQPIEILVSEERRLELEIKDNRTFPGGEEVDALKQQQSFFTTISKGGNIVEISPQGHSIALFGLADENAPGLTVNNRLLEDWIQPVGSVYIGQNKTNPNEIFGFGTWELYDKQFKQQHIRYLDKPTIFDLNTTNFQNPNIVIGLEGHTVWFRFRAISKRDCNPNVDYAVGVLNSSEIGITSTMWTTYIGGYMEYSGQPAGPAGFHLDYDGDVTKVVGAVGNNKTTAVSSSSPINPAIIAGTEYCFTTSFQISWEVMDDNYCDKFYWRRIE